MTGCAVVGVTVLKPSGEPGTPSIIHVKLTGFAIAVEVDHDPIETINNSPHSLNKDVVEKVVEHALISTEKTDLRGGSTERCADYSLVGSGELAPDKSDVPSV